MRNGAVTVRAVVEAGSFRNAARAPDIAPSGVSRAIARLEEELGVRLFNRHPRAVALTENGQRLGEMVRPLMAGISEATETMRESTAVVSGRLRVQACPPFAHGIRAPNLGAFLDRHPDLELHAEGSATLSAIPSTGASARPVERRACLPAVAPASSGQGAQLPRLRR